MQLQFQQEACSCLQRPVSQTNIQEQTQEIRLPEGMPDVGRVLGAWGQILIRGKEWHSGGAGVSGGVLAWVLYAPEDGSEVRSVDTWIPFQSSWELRDVQRDGVIHIWPLLSGIDARCVSARKIMLRCQISIHGQAFLPSETQMYLPQQVPEDVQLLKNSYPMLLPKEAGEKQFTVRQTVQSQTDIRKVLRCEADMEVTEQRILGNRLVFRGNCNVYILCCDGQEQIRTVESTVPFSQYTELEGEYGEQAQADIQGILTAMEVETDEEGAWCVQCGVAAQYIINDMSMVHTVEDAFSNCRKVETESSELRLPARLEQHKEQTAAACAWEGDCQEILDTAWFCGHPVTQYEGEGLHTALESQFQLLYRDAEGTLQTAVVKNRQKWQTDAGKNAKLQFTMQRTGWPSAQLGAGQVTLQQPLYTLRECIGDGAISVLTGLELGQTEEPEGMRPTVILRRAEGLGLWELAKECGSSVEAIREANELEGEPEYRRMLLIPVL